jgi:hypothetical protein
VNHRPSIAALAAGVMLSGCSNPGSSSSVVFRTLSRSVWNDEKLQLLEGSADVHPEHQTSPGLTVTDRGWNDGVNNCVSLTSISRRS